MNQTVKEKLAENKIHQYHIYWCKANVQISGDVNLNITVNKMRPVLVLSKDLANATANVITVAPMTSKQTKTKIPQHVYLATKGEGKPKTIALIEQIMTIKKSLISPRCIYTPTAEEIVEIKKAITDLLIKG